MESGTETEEGQGSTFFLLTQEEGARSRVVV